MRMGAAPVRGQVYSRGGDIAVALGLMLVGFLGDVVTGPEIPAAAFYLAAVAWTTWRLAWRWGVVCALAATTLNLLCDWRTPIEPHPGFSLGASEFMGFVVLASVVALTGVARRQQQIQEAQRSELDAYYQRMEADLHTAQRLQRLLMGTVPDVPGWEIGTFLQTSRIVGGDICRVSTGPDGVTALLIADVCGKGSSAALTGAMLLGLIDDAADAFTSPAATLKYLNDRLLGLLPDNLFVTAFYALADGETGRLLYSAGGHEPSLLFRGSAVEELREAGPALGLFPAAQYPETRLSLAPGDLLLCYTDGILDYKSKGGTRRDVATLESIAAEHWTRPCAEMVRAIAEAVTGVTTDIPDDISLLALRRIGNERPR